MVMLSADTTAPYFRPALSKEYLRGELHEHELPVESGDFYREHEIELRLREPVTELIPGRHRARTRSGTTIDYGHCVLATGARPSPPSVPGLEHKTTRTLRSLQSSSELRSDAERSETVAVVGSGFIGCEAAVSLARRGKSVTLTAPEDLPQQQRLGAFAGAHILAWLHAEGVHTELSAPLADVTADGRLRLADGRTIDAELTLLATGIQPRVELAAEAGLAVNSGRIRTDTRMRTTAPDVYAAGDVALADNAMAGRPLPVEHWGEALAMGEIAGTNIAGADTEWRNPPGFWTALGERTLKYSAWGDGFDETRVFSQDDGSFTVWYGSDGVIVGVLTHNADTEYERGTDRVRRAVPLSEVG